MIFFLLYYNDAPPSIGNTTPVRYAACSDAKNTTTLATSSGVPTRPKGILSFFERKL